MSIFPETERILNDNRFFAITDMPAFCSGESVASFTSTLCDYFKAICQGSATPQHPEGMTIIPSPMELSVFFQCSEMEVLDALNNLKRDGYQYELFGIDLPVRLRDPLTHNQRSCWYSGFFRAPAIHYEAFATG